MNVATGRTKGLDGGPAHFSAYSGTVRRGAVSLKSPANDNYKTQVKAYRGYIKAKYLKGRAGESSRKYSAHSASVDIEIPIAGSITPSLQLMLQKATHDQRVYLNTNIFVSDTLILDVEMHADLNGMYAQASKLEASFGSMLLESVQNILESENNGVSFGFGFAGGKASLDSIGAHIQDRSRHVVDSLSALIGTESVNLVVARALHLTGAMIANAEKDENGALTDHGHMTAKIGELFVQHIYDYDDGKTLAAAMSFAQNTKVKDKGGKAIDYFSLQGTLGSFDKDGYTHPTLGQGDITIENNPAELAKAHRDAATPQTFETHHDIKPTFLYYSNLDTKTLRDAIPSSPSAWAKSVGTTVAETLGFGTFGETEEEKSKRLEQERIAKAVEEFERKHEQYRKEQEALQEIDSLLMDSQYADDYSGIGNERKRVSVVFLANKVKTENPGISTEKALDIARSVVHEAEQKLAMEPAYEPAFAPAIGAVGGLGGATAVIACTANPICVAAVGGTLLVVGAITLIQWAPQLKIKVLSTPIHENKGSILSTPAQESKPDLEQFPAHEDKGSTLSTPQHRGEADVEGFDKAPKDAISIIFEYEIDGKKFQEHHIISDKHDLTKNHDLWKHAGVDPQSRDNKIFLPTEAEYHPTRSIHKGRHWDSVSKTLEKKMDYELVKGQVEKWSQAQYKDALQKILKEERASLRNGERALNKHNREWSDAQSKK